MVAASYTIGLAVPDVRPLLHDGRVAGADGGAIAYQVLIRIPLGTVLWEETAFRGVLLAALLRVLPPRTAVGISAGKSRSPIWLVKAASTMASSRMRTPLSSPPRRSACSKRM